MTFDTIEAADRALGEPHMLEGRALNLNSATPERADPAAPEVIKRLYIGDLLTTTTEDELRTAFGPFGKLEVPPGFHWGSGGGRLLIVCLPSNLVL